MTFAALHLENHLPVTLTAPGLSEAEFLALAEDFPDCFLEYTSEGTVLIMPPTDPETGTRVFEVGDSWETGRRRMGVEESSARTPASFSPTALAGRPMRRGSAPNAGRTRSSLERDSRFRSRVRNRVRSPEQRAAGLREKLTEYIANGVQLGWLIDPMEGTVEIYRQGRAPELLDHPPAWRAKDPFTASCWI